MRYRALRTAYDDWVNNRATPRGILVTVAFLALYCAFAVWFGLTHRYWLMVAIGLLAAIGCVGAANMLRWSRFVTYALSIGFAASWLYSICIAARVGYFGPLAWQTIILSLMPGFLLLIIACFCSWMTHRHLASAACCPRGNPAGC
jgi:hypothetical protein